MKDIGESVLLAETNIEFVLDGRTIRVPARVIESFTPIPRVVFEVTDVPREPQTTVETQIGGTDVINVPLTSEGPSTIDIESGLQVPVVPSSWIYLQHDATIYPARSPFVALDNGRPISYMEFDVLNFSSDLGNLILVLENSPWVTNIVPVPSVSDLKKTLSTTMGYSVTNRGRLTHVDGDPFFPEQAEAFLNSLSLFLSFTSGAHCSITNVRGFDHYANPAWVRWGARYVSPWGKRRTWFDMTISHHLAAMFQAFSETLRDWPQLGRAIMVYLESNVSGMLDVALILAQTVLEILVFHGVGGRRKREKTGDWIARGLEGTNVSLEIPEHFSAMRRQGEHYKWQHGPHALVSIRDSIVHAGPKVSPSTDAMHEAKQLAMWYIELQLLKLFQHNGHYASRLNEIQRPGATEMVPWAD